MKMFWMVGLVTLLSVAIASPGFGQDLSAGVKGGITFSDLGGDFEDIIETSTDLKTGFSVGGFFGADLHRLFRLQGEAQYVQKGTKADLEGVTGKFKLAYFEVLVPLTFLIPVEGARIVPRLYAGPAVAFELSCKVSGELGGVSVDTDCDDESVDAPTKSVDFGAFAGAGVDIMAGPGAITLDVLYNLGLADINDFPGDPNSVKNRNIQIMAGYGFRFGT